MIYRNSIPDTAALAAWYDAKYKEMGDGWYTPPIDCIRHLDALGVPYDRSKWLLDIGCGAAHFLEHAIRRVSCVGLEISNCAIALATNRLLHMHVNLQQASIETFRAPLGLRFNYILSIGSLEHVIDIGAALDSVKCLLEPDGRWYFYCPNELWVHEDQPNERTATDAEWIALFLHHGLETKHSERWGDNTAFWGGLAAV